MSSYLQVTKNPDSGEFEKAEWLDNYFGHYQYAVRFPSTGKVFRASEHRWEFESTPATEILGEKE
jgi:hypothetical protein